MKLTAQQKLIIGILIIVVVVVAAVLLLIVPQISRLGDLNSQIEQAEQDYEAATLLLKRRQEAKARAAATEAELESPPEASPRVGFPYMSPLQELALRARTWIRRTSAKPSVPPISSWSAAA